MNEALSKSLNERIIKQLKTKLAEGAFPGLNLEQAMQFILTDGSLPASGLPLQSFYELEDWLRSDEAQNKLRYTATELKNKTGEILEKALQGYVIQIEKHGRPIVDLKAVES